MSQWNLKRVTSQSVFKLLQTTSEELNSLNKGFNKGETNVGFFYFVGYNEPEKMYLIAKPLYDFDEPHTNKGVVMNEEYYIAHCICLLSFTLNNN